MTVPGSVATNGPGARTEDGTSPPATEILREPHRFEKRVVGSLVKTLFLRGRRGGPWAVPAHLEHHAAFVVGNSGAKLAVLHFPRAGSRGIVVLAHPDRRYGKHWFLREGWVEWLLENGFEVVAFDFAAYGASRGGSTYFHEDIVAVCEWAARERPGLPLHLVGLSIGAFASINAAVRLPGISGLVLESPYPTFDSWYDHARGVRTLRATNRVLGRIWPRTYRRIDAGRNAPNVRARRILVAATRDDAVTPLSLSRRVADLLPADRTQWLELSGEHLGLFNDERYRKAILETLESAGAGPGDGSVGQPAAKAGRKAPANGITTPPRLISHLG